eukprot:355266-Chlamydomonas_euryale.AAC.5
MRTLIVRRDRTSPRRPRRQRHDARTAQARNLARVCMRDGANKGWVAGANRWRAGAGRLAQRAAMSPREKRGRGQAGDMRRGGARICAVQHPATKSARPSALEAKDAHQPHSGGIRSARAGKKRGPMMVSRRPVTTRGKVTERC